jgi:aspartate kinase
LAGAKVLHPKALRYKKNSTILRVVGFDDENLSGGTVIKGELESELNATLYEHDLSMITMISEEASTPDLVLKVLSSASSTNAKILGVVIESSSLILYVQNPADLVQQLHETIRTKGTAKAIHCIDSIAMIAVSGPQLEEIPGIVDIVVSPIANKGVNIYGVLTISSSVRVFVPWKDREETLSLVNDSIKKVHQLKRGD